MTDAMKALLADLDWVEHVLRDHCYTNGELTLPLARIRAALATRSAAVIADEAVASGLCEWHNDHQANINAAYEQGQADLAAAPPVAWRYRVRSGKKPKADDAVEFASNPAYVEMYKRDIYDVTPLYEGWP